MNMPRKNSFVVQNAWVVRDIDAAMNHWTKTMGVGPFLELPKMVPDRYSYRGRDLMPDIRVSCAQSGDMQIELMQVLSDGPSVYGDMFAANEEGFHHVCVFTDDIDQDLAAHRGRGLDVVVEGAAGNGRFAFVDARPTIGCMIEIVTDGPLIRSIYDAVRAASENWDGRDPVRPFTF